MSGIQPEDGSPPYRNWTSGSELNETREALLTPSSDYDDEEFLRYLWKEYLHPKEYEWALIAGYIVVFIVALIGNVLGESSSPKLPVLPSRDRFCTEGGWKPGWVWHIPLERQQSPAAGESSGCAEGAAKAALSARARGGGGGRARGAGWRSAPGRPGGGAPRLPAGSRPCPPGRGAEPSRHGGGSASQPAREDAAAPPRSPGPALGMWSAGRFSRTETGARDAGTGMAPGPRRGPAASPRLPAGAERAAPSRRRSRSGAGPWGGGEAAPPGRSLRERGGAVPPLEPASSRFHSSLKEAAGAPGPLGGRLEGSGRGAGVWRRAEESEGRKGGRGCGGRERCVGAVCLAASSPPAAPHRSSSLPISPVRSPEPAAAHGGDSPRAVGTGACAGAGERGHACAHTRAPLPRPAVPPSPRGGRVPLPAAVPPSRAAGGRGSGAGAAPQQFRAYEWTRLRQEDPLGCGHGHWHSLCPSLRYWHERRALGPAPPYGSFIHVFEKELCVPKLSLLTLRASRSEMQMRLQPKAIILKALLKISTN